MGEKVLSREDFIFTIGYDGPAAVVDKQAKRKYGKLSTRELAEKGFFRAAYSSAVHSGDKNELKLVVDTFKRLGTSTEDFKADMPGSDSGEADQSALDRLFGVQIVDVKRYIYL